MRHVYVSLAVALVLLTASAPRAQWTPESPSPTRLDIRGIAAPTTSHVFVATEDDSFDSSGALFESADGGVSWTQRSVPADGFSPFNGLFFLDAERGWAYGNENVRTTDGGVTWQALPFLGSTYHMEFFTPSFGVASTNGGLSVSRDGGSAWGDAPNGLYDFDFADAQTGLGVSPGGLYRTADGGLTFTLVRSGSATAATFLSPTVAVAVVGDAFVRSADAGLTWTPAGPAQGRSRLEAVSSDIVLAWGVAPFFPNDDATLLRSADGGQTWTSLGAVVGQGTLALTAASASSVVALDVRGDVYHSGNAGATWALAARSPGPRPSAFSEIRPAFADAQTGYVGYGAGYVLKTTDGGATWTQVSSGSGASLHGVARLGNGALVAVGDDGSVLTRGADGRWTLRPALGATPFGAAGLQAVQATGGAAAVTVASDARVYRTADGGATWTAAPGAPSDLSARDLSFTTALDGWLVGAGFDASALYHTTDGGATWAAGPSDYRGQWVAVDARGDRVRALRYDGFLARTDDGGATWTAALLPGASSATGVADLAFFDDAVGYAVGANGYTARTSDGGATWTRLPAPNAAPTFTSLTLVGPGELWATTNTDVVYYSATGGQSWAEIPVGTDVFGGFAGIAATAEGEAFVVAIGGIIRHFAGPPPAPENRPPVAAFTSVTNRLTVAFTDTSTDPDGAVVAWAWDFGDGDTSADPNPTHTYAAAGTYLPRLTVTDDDGATGVTGRAIVVSPGPGGTFGGFTEVTPFALPFVTPQDEDFWVATTAPADYDGDGDIDVAVLGYYVVYNQSVDERLMLLRNDGAGPADEWTFTTVDVDLGDLSSGASDMAWGDADGDGDADLVVATDGETALYRNDSGTLVRTATVLPGYYEDNDQGDFDLRSVAWADIDNDGDLDLLIPSVFDESAFEFRTALMRNDGLDGDGGWTFTEIDAGLDPTRHAQSAWADSDGDGDLDLLLVNVAPLNGEGFIRHYRNDGDGTFTAETLLDGLTVEHGEVQWGDVDADGDLDLLVVGNLGETDGTFTPAALRVYRNDGGTYAQTEVLACPACEGWFDLTAATWADYDSDGDMDILVTGSYNSGSQIDGRAQIFLNEGSAFTDAGVTLPAPRAGGTRGGAFSWLDLDGDLDLDYFVAGEYFVPGGNGLIEAQMHAYLNDAEGANRAPTAPAGLTATAAGAGRVALAWAAASDDSTPAGALTYDLDLRLNGAPVATPRRLPEPGGISTARAWTLDGLAEGTYTWRVRAIDSAFNGGPAAVGTFTVGPVGAEGDSPLVYALDETFPNPFRAVTMVRYSLPLAGPVDVSVYDVLGRLVTRLVHDDRPAGAHDVRWDASGLASGAYVIRFSAGEFSAIRRVTLMR